MLFKLSDSDPEYPAVTLANYMLGGHTTSRLYNRIRAKEGLSYGVGSVVLSDSALDRRTRWISFAITNPVNIGKVEAAFRDEVERALKEGFTAAEVEAAKKGWLQARNVQRAQDSALATRLVAHEHENRTLAYEEDLEKKVAGLTLEQINSAFRNHLKPAAISIVQAGDFKKSAAAAK
jgi:zinc protease